MAGTQPRTVPARGADPEGRGDSEGDRSRRGGDAPAGTEEAPQTHGRHPLSTLLPAARPAAASPLARLAGLLHRRPDPARDRRAIRRHLPHRALLGARLPQHPLCGRDRSLAELPHGIAPVGRDRPGSGGTDADPVQQHRGQRPRPDQWMSPSFSKKRPAKPVRVTDSDTSSQVGTRFTSEARPGNDGTAPDRTPRSDSGR